MIELQKHRKYIEFAFVWLGAIAVIIIIFGVSGFGDDITYFLKPEIDKPTSITFAILLIGLVGIIVYSLLRRKIYGFANDTIHIKNAELYYNHVMSLIKAIAAAFIVGLSLLWGFVISSGGKKSEILSKFMIDTNSRNLTVLMDNYPEVYSYIDVNITTYADIIQQQGLVIFVIIGYVLLNLYVMAIIDFRDILQERTE